MKVTSLILAAGHASGTKQAQLLLGWKGKSLLAHAVSAARAADLESITLVLGAHFKETSWEAQCLEVDFVNNPDWKSGTASSIRAGVAHTLAREPATEAILILLADQPLVSSRSIRKLLSAAETPEFGGFPLIAAAYSDTVGVPAVFGPRFFPELLALTGETGAQEILSRWKAQLISVSLPEASFDIDAPTQHGELTQSDTS